MQQPDVNDLIMSVSKPIKWVVPDSIRTEHATNIVVQQRASEFTILLFEVYDKPAIYRIVSILEPYMETTQELDLHMPPISSRRVTVNVTDRGRAKPDLYIE